MNDYSCHITGSTAPAESKARSVFGELFDVNVVVGVDSQHKVRQLARGKGSREEDVPENKTVAD